MKREEQDKTEIREEVKKETKAYEKPECKSYKPLELVSKYRDKSSELVF